MDSSFTSADSHTRVTAGPTLSFGLIALNAERGIGRLLAAIRTVADEIIVGVDAASTDRTEQIALNYADRVFRLPPIGFVENALAWLNQQCTGDWIFRIDADELPSVRLIDAVPRLIADRDITHYYFPRRWIIDREETRWISDTPWWPDWQLRLFRNIPSIVRVPGTLHSSYELAGAAGYICDGAIYHYDLAHRNDTERQQKIAKYAEIAPARTLRSFYFPDLSVASTRPIPANDEPPCPSANLPVKSDNRRSAIVVSADEIQAAKCDECDRPSEFFHATITPVENIPSLRPAQVFHLEVVLRNDGTRIWPASGSGQSPVHLSYHWFDTSGDLLDREGTRTVIPRPLHPGEEARMLAEVRAPQNPGDYVLEWDLVIENVAWFSERGMRTSSERVRVEA